MQSTNFPAGYMAYNCVCDKIKKKHSSSSTGVQKADTDKRTYIFTLVAGLILSRHSAMFSRALPHSRCPTASVSSSNASGAARHDSTTDNNIEPIVILSTVDAESKVMPQYISDMHMYCTVSDMKDKRICPLLQAT